MVFTSSPPPSDDTTDPETHRQTHSITPLPTHSITLHPTTAIITRTIPNLTLHPGKNELTITHLSAHAHEPSFRVSGHGTTATITALSATLIHAPQHRPDEDTANAQLLLARKKITREADNFDWDLNTALNSVAALEIYGRSLCFHEPAPIDTFQTFLCEYASTRAEAGALRAAIHAKKDALAEKWEALDREQAALVHRRRDGKEYPYYQLKIMIEAGTLPEDAPSVEARVDTGGVDEDKPSTGATAPSLRISYRVSQARWEPGFELRVDTVARTAVLGFWAEARNGSGELWRDAEVKLSTVESKILGRGERIPELGEWRVGAGKKVEGEASKYSQSEWWGIQKGAAAGIWATSTSSGGLFGITGGSAVQNSSGGLFGAASGSAVQSSSGGLFGAASGSAVQSSSGGLFGAASGSAVQSPSGGLFGAPQMPIAGFGGTAAQSSPGAAFGAPSSLLGVFGDASTQSSSGGLFGAPPASGGFGTQSTTPSTNLFRAPPDAIKPDPEQSASSLFATPLPYNPASKMTLSSSTATTYGTSTIFSLPGKKTLPTSTTLHRFFVSDTKLTDLDLTYTVIPKLRLAAFLTASFTLPSTAPPLPRYCIAAVHLDGAFLGTQKLPARDASGRISVPIGVDEDIEVEYDVPVRRVEPRGLFGKQERVTFERGWRVRNMRKTSVTVVVRDQISVGGRVLLEEPVAGTEGVEFGKLGLVEWRVVVAAGEERAERLVWNVIADCGAEEELVSLS